METSCINFQAIFSEKNKENVILSCHKFLPFDLIRFFFKFLG